MTYSTQEEREEHAKLARKKSNQKFYDDLKKNKEAYKERLDKAGKKSMERYNLLDKNKNMCAYCGHCVMYINVHEATKRHKESVEIMDKLFLEL